MNNHHLMGKGEIKVSPHARIFKTRDTETGTRPVRIDHKTIVLTKCETDQEAIDKYNRIHR